MTPIEKPDDPFDRCPIDWSDRTFAVKSYYATSTPESVIISATTDRPAHLFMSWSTTRPVVHRKARTLRGLRTMEANYWCFAHFETLEQIEQGSTLIHTFDFKNWPICQTRWFYFFGQLCTPLEQWHKTLTDNNPWVLVPGGDPPDYQIEYGRLSLSSTGAPTRGVQLSDLDAYFPLESEYRKDLHINAYFSATDGNPANHHCSLLLLTVRDDDYFYIKLLISRGNKWATPGANIWATGHTGGIDLGRGPYWINLVDLWRTLRVMAGLSPGPTGWTLHWLRLALEQDPAAGTNQITNDWLDVYYFPWAGIVPSHSPIFHYHNPGFLLILSLEEPWTWKGDQPPDFTLLLDELWAWKGDEQPDWGTSQIIRRLVPGNNGAHIWYDDPTWYITLDGVDACCGYLYNKMTSQGSPARFLDIQIPKGATILSAEISYFPFGQYHLDTVASYLHAQKAADPQPLSTIEDYFDRPRTDAFIDWTPIPHFEYITRLNTPDLAALIQEVVDLPDWSPGNPLLIFWQDHAARTTPVDNTQRRAWQICPDYPERNPILTIAFTPPLPIIEPWTWKGEEQPDFMLLLDEPWG